MPAPEVVLIHPLVLLSVVDHYKRMALAPGKRVLGVLLGYWTGPAVHVTNSYAVPFEENEKDPTVWYIDHNYHENMGELAKKINAKERFLGWYHSGPKLRPSDLMINGLFSKYTPTPILAIIDALDASPVQAFYAVEEQQGSDGGASTTFVHIPAAIEAEEAEEVGVEHLLRDLKQLSSAPSLAQAIAEKVKALGLLERELAALDAYLASVLSAALPTNQAVLGAIQDMFNLLPDVHGPAAEAALTVKTNEQMASVYVASLVRTALALNDLVSNRIAASLVVATGEAK